MLHGRNALDDRRMPLINAGANFLKRQMRVLAYEIEKRIARNDNFAAAQAGTNLLLGKTEALGHVMHDVFEGRLHPGRSLGAELSEHFQSHLGRERGFEDAHLEKQRLQAGLKLADITGNVGSDEVGHLIRQDDLVHAGLALQDFPAHLERRKPHVGPYARADQGNELWIYSFELPAGTGL